MSDSFENALKTLDSLECRKFKNAIIDVSDTMRMGLLWFESKGVEPTAQALVDYAKLVMDRESKDA